jgi:hypothetical protein
VTVEKISDVHARLVYRQPGAEVRDSEAIAGRHLGSAPRRPDFANDHTAASSVSRRGTQPCLKDLGTSHRIGHVCQRLTLPCCQPSVSLMGNLWRRERVMADSKIGERVGMR